jgi:hypothetical protein
MFEGTLNTPDLEVFPSEEDNFRVEKAANWTTISLGGMISKEN